MDRPETRFAWNGDVSVASERASILATYESAVVASLFAAVYPDRTRSLILVDPLVTYLPTAETPWMPSFSRWQEQIALIRDTWGTPDWWDSPKGPEREWFSRYALEHSSQSGHHFHWYARGDSIVAEVGRFLAQISEDEVSFDRILATVLFTDIVDSTKRATDLGDRGWQVVERHHATVRTLLARYRGTGT